MFFIVAVVTAAGCNKKFLEDMKSYDKFDESMFANEVLTGAYIDRLYNYYFVNYKNPMLTLVGLYNGDRSGSTEETGGNITWTNPNKNTYLASQASDYYGIAPKDVDNKAYTRIRFCNFLIEKVNGGSAASLSEDFKKTAKGQMFFMRGLQYFDLVRVYGGVPLVLNVQDASIDDESIKIPRAKTSEVFDQIISDFDSAAALLPEVWPNGATNFGRFTSYAALAMKSRVLLTAASPLFNTDWDNPGNQRWQKALEASLAAEAELGNKGGYGKSINNAKQWAEVTFANDNNFNGEGIIVQLLSNNTSTPSTANYNSWESAMRPAEFKGTGGISVPREMLNVFPLADGSRPVIGVNYNDTFFFENRDPRFYRTFAFPGTKWAITSNANHVYWMYRWKDKNNKIGYYLNNQMISPAVVRKGSNPKADSANFAASGTDIFDYRWAELLLNIAECYAATGNTAKCVEYLQKLRIRVGIPAGSNNYGLGNPVDRYAALEACLYERRVELAYEGKRFWDLQRWMLYDDDPSIGDMTNAKLGIPKLNGTARTGYYWQAKAVGVDQTTDPYVNDKGYFAIDPDGNATAFKNQIDSLKKFFNNKFVWTPLDKPMDNDNGAAVNILFRSNYYIGGFQSALLSNNPWLTQTIGWQDFNGAMGTFDYRQ